MNVDYAENIIATTGRLIGGAYKIDRPIGANDAIEVRDVSVTMIEDYRRAYEQDLKCAAEAISAENEERAALYNKLANLGVVVVEGD